MINNDISKKEIAKYLQMPFDEFKNTVMKAARQQKIDSGNVLKGSAMLSFTNYCKNQCTYCGMRASHKIPRYRLTPEVIIEAAAHAKDSGFNRIFLISGVDPNYGFDDLLHIVSQINSFGLEISMACGEFEKTQFQELAEAGVKRYALKFEMGQQENYNRLNPSSDYYNRLDCTDYIKQSGMKLCTGGIVDYPGQTLEELAEDIKLTVDLGSDWAPCIPYLPVEGTPLAAEGNRGSIELMLKTISIWRLMKPDMDITAEQPGEDMTRGLGDLVYNLDAVNAGADILFADLLPDVTVPRFTVIDNRFKVGLEHIKEVAEKANMKLSL